ncbi:MAG: alpha-amylase family glycosyl hydrolase [Promethearchaeota archaeon]
MNETKREGFRIYNLFPRLAGTVDKWEVHLKRIRRIGFNWTFINPVSFPGFSGSLYAVKDYFKFNPDFAPQDSDDRTSWVPFMDFIDACHKRGIKLMYDLVINHTSIDSDLVKLHPNWYTRKQAVIHEQSKKVVYFYDLDAEPDLEKYPPDKFEITGRIANPFAIDPANANNITIWGDLAELNYKRGDHIKELLEFLHCVIDHYLRLGIDGFRCDAAYKIPPAIWMDLMHHARKTNEDVVFIAETLGCTLQQIKDVASAGFNYIFNSSKWWDFTAPWCITQYEQFRQFTPSISFPESHDTDRLMHESGGREDVQKFRYFFAAFFSTGLLMPVGYEFGFRKKLDVIHTKPDDWETPAIDLTEFIHDVNNFKKKFRCLNEEGPITHLDYNNKSVLLLKKSTNNNDQQMLLVYNKDWHRAHEVIIDDLSVILDLATQIYQVDIHSTLTPVSGTVWRKTLAPNEFQVFFQEKHEEFNGKNG